MSKLKNALLFVIYPSYFRHTIDSLANKMIIQIYSYFALLTLRITVKP